MLHTCCSSCEVFWVAETVAFLAGHYFLHAEISAAPHRLRFKTVLYVPCWCTASGSKQFCMFLLLVTGQELVLLPGDFVMLNVSSLGLLTGIIRTICLF